MVIFRSCADNLLGGIWAMSSPPPKILGGSSPPVPPLDYARACRMQMPIFRPDHTRPVKSITAPANFAQSLDPTRPTGHKTQKTQDAQL